MEITQKQLDEAREFLENAEQDMEESLKVSDLEAYAQDELYYAGLCAMYWVLTGRIWTGG